MQLYWSWCTLHSTNQAVIFSFILKVICDAGMEPNDVDEETCDECAIGTYKEESGATDCLPCKTGFTTADVGTIPATACDVRKYK